ncbi:N-acetylmuramoyl-L-alanine amidase [Paracoccus pacificus]|uniref:N-acetylmuramoyl-L-alanine amidase n=1 Tax=Paracoccus pacificus TaxID=1463598 RepID=A0ABW4R9P8_9RHOB
MRPLALVLLILAVILGVGSAQAKGESGLARLNLDQSRLELQGRDRGRPRPIDLTLSLSQPVPYRVMLIDGPPRLVVDFQEVDFAGTRTTDLPGADAMPGLRWGPFRPGWSRLVLDLGSTYALSTASMDATRAQGGALIRIRLDPVAAKDFRPRSGAAFSALWDLPQPAEVPPIAGRGARGDGARKLTVTLDPGHGGFDPGAQADGATEAVLTLVFARQLAEKLTRAGAEVTLTRRKDSFVPLEQRMTLARTSGADIFISIHADALPEADRLLGARGATIYLWDEKADDRAARELAMRHDRADLLAGIDLRGIDDQVATVMMDMARTDTQPRARKLAEAMAQRMGDNGIGMHKRPVQGAAFSVLKSPDFPSVLLELGFLTDPLDRANLTDPAWRTRAADAAAAAIMKWARDDAAAAALLRR